MACPALAFPATSQHHRHLHQVPKLCHVLASNSKTVGSAGHFDSKNGNKNVSAFDLYACPTSAQWRPYTSGHPERWLLKKWPRTEAESPHQITLGKCWFISSQLSAKLRCYGLSRSQLKKQLLLWSVCALISIITYQTFIRVPCLHLHQSCKP